MQSAVRTVESQQWFATQVKDGHQFGGMPAGQHRNNNVDVRLSRPVRLRFASGSGKGAVEVCTFPAGTDVVIYRPYRDFAGSNAIATFFMPDEQVTFMDGALLRRRPYLRR